MSATTPAAAAASPAVGPALAHILSATPALMNGYERLVADFTRQLQLLEKQKDAVIQLQRAKTPPSKADLDPIVRCFVVASEIAEQIRLSPEREPKVHHLLVSYHAKQSALDEICYNYLYAEGELSFSEMDRDFSANLEAPFIAKYRNLGKILRQAHVQVLPPAAAAAAPPAMDNARVAAPMHPVPAEPAPAAPQQAEIPAINHAAQIPQPPQQEQGGQPVVRPLFADVVTRMLEQSRRRNLMIAAEKVVATGPLKGIFLDILHSVQNFLN